LAILNKESTVFIYDFRNMSAPLNQITPKQNTSLEICAASWDRSDSVLFLVGGEYIPLNAEATMDLFPYTILKIMK
jgi:hypothetical protein